MGAAARKCKMGEVLKSNTFEKGNPFCCCLIWRQPPSLSPPPPPSNQCTFLTSLSLLVFLLSVLQFKPAYPNWRRGRGGGELEKKAIKSEGFSQCIFLRTFIRVCWRVTNFYYHCLGLDCYMQYFTSNTIFYCVRSIYILRRVTPGVNLFLLDFINFRHSTRFYSTMYCRTQF